MDAVRFASREGGVTVYFPEGKTFSALSALLAEKLETSARFLEKRSALFCLDDMGFSPEEREQLSGCIRAAYPNARVTFGLAEAEAEGPALSRPPETVEGPVQPLPSPKRVAVGRYAREEGELTDDGDYDGRHAQPRQQPQPAAPVIARQAAAVDAVLVYGLRGGQQVEAEGSVLVYGNVNPGAQIKAGGHVMVMGTLAGRVHAGAKGDSGATVSALHMKPQQLRIGDAFWSDPLRRRDARSAGAELARLNSEGRVELVSLKDGL